MTTGFVGVSLPRLSAFRKMKNPEHPYPRKAAILPNIPM